MTATWLVRARGCLCARFDGLELGIEKIRQSADDSSKELQLRIFFAVAHRLGNNHKLFFMADPRITSLNWLCRRLQARVREFSLQ